MSEVLKLCTRPDEVKSDVVQVLEDALEQARRGEILAVAVAVVRSDRTTAHRWSMSDHAAEMCGSTASMQHAFLSGGWS